LLGLAIVISSEGVSENFVGGSMSREVCSSLD
jgi:hypothetical protein